MQSTVCLPRQVDRQIDRLDRQIDRLDRQIDRQMIDRQIDRLIDSLLFEYSNFISYITSLHESRIETEVNTVQLH